MALLDTGSQVTTVTKEFVQKHPDLRKQSLRPSDVTICGAGGHAVRHLGVITVNIDVLGLHIKGVPTFVVPTTPFRRDTPVLVGTNVIRASRDKMKSSHGSKFMTMTHQESPQWFQAFQFVNEDGADLAKENGEIGCCRYAGRHSLDLSPGEKVTVPAWVPKVMRKRGITAMVDGSYTRGLAVGCALVEAQGSKVPVQLCNLSDHRVTLRRNSKVATLSYIKVIGPAAAQDGKQAVAMEQVAVSTTPFPEVDLQGADLTQTQRKAVDSLLLQNADIFSKGSLDVGSTNTVQHEIPLSDPTPFRLPYRRIPPSQYQSVRGHIEELKQAGIIQPSQSPFASPIVVVEKKDGTIRLCIDYRRLNARTVRDAFPLPRIDEALDALGKAKYFSCLDLTSGYHQVRMAVEDQPKTAFTSPMGLYEFTRMPFGLVNAPATFQRLMSAVLGDMAFESLLIYLDDIIVFSSTVEEHIERLSRVFDRLREHGLKLKPSKCQLFKTEVRYLGHVVSMKGISTDPGKILAVKSWPVPKCRRDVRSFLGMTGYYRRFIHQYAKIAAPLFALTGGK